MAAETGLITMKDILSTVEIDFVTKFAFSVQELMKWLQLTNMVAVNVGTRIKQYKWVFTEAAGGGAVAEGNIIPLSHAERKLAREIEIGFKKHRKQVSLEAVQDGGQELALSQSDSSMLSFLQKKIREEFFDLIATTAAANTILKAPSLQEAVAVASAKVQVAVDRADGGDTTVLVFVNPMDVATYLGENQLSSQGAVFGMTVMGDWMNVQLFVTNNVPEGAVQATCAENLNLFYANPAGQLGSLFDFTTDDSGLIAITHDPVKQRLVYETITTTGLTLFADLEDAVVQVDIEPTPAP